MVLHISITDFLRYFVWQTVKITTKICQNLEAWKHATIVVDTSPLKLSTTKNSAEGNFPYVSLKYAIEPAMRKESSELAHNSQVCVDPNNNILFPPRTLVQKLHLAG